MTGLEVLGALSGALTIAETSLKLMKSTAKFIKEVGVADKELIELRKKVGQLANTFEMVRVTKEAREKHKIGGAELRIWKVIGTSHQHCTAKLEMFGKGLDKLTREGKNVGKNPGWKEKVRIRMRLNSEESVIAQLEKTIDMHFQMLQVQLNCINIFVASPHQAQPGQVQLSLPVTDDDNPLLGDDYDPEEATSSWDCDLDTDSAIDMDLGFDDEELVRESTKAAKDFRDLQDPLISAIEEGDEDMIENLLRRGADPNYLDGDGWTAMHHAALDGDDEIMRILTKPQYNADINAECPAGKTPIHYAAQEGYTDVVEILLERGADVRKKDKVNRTCLDHAIGLGKYNVVKLLLSRADVVFDMDNLPDTSQDIKTLLKRNRNKSISPRSTNSSSSSSRSLFKRRW